jgi:hypothetical protein
MPTAPRVLPTASLSALLGEQRELEGWPNVELNAALLMAETLHAIGWPAAMVAAVLGLDAFAVERSTAEAVRS